MTKGFVTPPPPLSTHSLRLRCTLVQCTRILPSTTDYLYAPPARPTFPLVSERSVQKILLLDCFPCTLKQRAETEGLQASPIMGKVCASKSDLATKYGRPCPLLVFQVENCIFVSSGIIFCHEKDSCYQRALGTQRNRLF